KEEDETTEIHHRTNLVYEANWEWCRKLNDGRADLHDEGGHGLSLVKILFKDLTKWLERDRGAFHLFQKQNTGSGGQHFLTKAELQDAKTSYLNKLAATFYEKGYW
ncbi:hypothetical protein AVEN_220145-1, partial [Araneus ventricosus]